LSIVFTEYPLYIRPSSAGTIYIDELTSMPQSIRP